MCILERKDNIPKNSVGRFCSSELSLGHGINLRESRTKGVKGESLEGIERGRFEQRFEEKGCERP